MTYRLIVAINMADIIKINIHHIYSLKKHASNFSEYDVMSIHINYSVLICCRPIRTEGTRSFCYC